MNFIKDIVKSNIGVIKKYLNQYKADSKTGLSFRDLRQVIVKERFSIGETTLFGTPFFYSDNLGFLHSIDEIFKDEIYKFSAETSDPYIVDCGANIGLSVYYFKRLYPGAEIIAFEPDEEIFALLKRNIENLPDGKKITLEKKAVWRETTKLDFFSEGSLAGSIVTQNNGWKKITIEAVDLNLYLNRKVDFLKLDIEGAENEIISHIEGNLYNVKNMFIEYHGIIGQPQNLAQILNLLTRVGFQYYIRVAGETMKFPFVDKNPVSFNQQLNIFCYRTEDI